MCIVFFEIFNVISDITNYVAFEWLWKLVRFGLHMNAFLVGLSGELIFPKYLDISINRARFIVKSVVANSIIVELLKVSA